MASGLARLHIYMSAIILTTMMVIIIAPTGLGLHRTQQAAPGRTTQACSAATTRQDQTRPESRRGPMCSLSSMQPLSLDESADQGVPDRTPSAFPSLVEIQVSLK
jgi:hypothetical protein